MKCANPACGVGLSRRNKTVKAYLKGDSNFVACLRCGTVVYKESVQK